VKALRVVLQPDHLRKTGLTALVVGTWLTAINQGDVLVSSGLHWHVALKIFLNYLTPFVVANIGLLSRN
jgi:hypothetical protein